MATMEEPKRPQSGYFLYVNATREKVQTEIGGKAFGAVTKIQAERWKSLPADEKSNYEQQAADLKAKHETDLAAFKEAGGVVGQKRAEKKDAKQAKIDKAAAKQSDADKPKKPVGGAYGVFMNKHRAEIQQSLPAGSAVSAVAPVASAKWKALSEEAKKPYDEEYQQVKARYDADVKAWKDAKVEAAGADDDDKDGEVVQVSPQKDVQTPSKKRTKPDSKVEVQQSPPEKKAKGRCRVSKVESTPGTTIDVKVLEQATKFNLDGALKNLASREELSHISADKMLAALQNSEGLVNKAKAVLLGA